MKKRLSAPHNGTGLTRLFQPEASDRLRREELGPYLDPFVDQLVATGYRPVTIRQYVGPVIHFGVWLERRGVRIVDVDRDIVALFCAHLVRCRCGRRRRVRRCGSSEIVGAAVRLFVDHLRRRAVIRVRLPSAPKIVEEFAYWMRRHRGLAERTLTDYRQIASQFVVFTRGRRWRCLNAKTLRGFVICHHATMTQPRMLVLVRGLRMFVRFLVATSRCSSHLTGAVPSVPHWRLATLPRYLATADVERIIAGCAATTMTGARDRAVLLLLARLALRAGEVRQIQLSDLDWRGARLRVVGKPRRPTWLPLPQEVGDAILAYLRLRPACSVPELFLCTNAPYRPLGATGVAGICQRAIDAIGLSSPNKGAHVFRHSAATTLIRHGASLDDVGRLLRHTSRESTAIYAKVAFSSLHRIAQPWPEATT